MKIKIWKLVIGVRWHNKRTDDKIREELIAYMKNQNLIEKEHDFTCIELHYNCLPKQKGRCAYGTMIIRRE